MHKERLLKLAEHLETGKLGHEVFDFSQFNNANTNICGTAGCAIGECPVIWPDEWEFCTVGLPTLKDKYTPRGSATSFFGIISKEYDHLFIPTHQNINEYGGKVLGIDATKEQVATNIREFVKRKEKLDNK